MRQTLALLAFLSGCATVNHIPPDVRMSGHSSAELVVQKNRDFAGQSSCGYYVSKGEADGELRYICRVVGCAGIMSSQVVREAVSDESGDGLADLFCFETSTRYPPPLTSSDKIKRSECVTDFPLKGKGMDEVLESYLTEPLTD